MLPITGAPGTGRVVRKCRGDRRRCCLSVFVLHENHEQIHPTFWAFVRFYQNKCNLIITMGFD